MSRKSVIRIEDLYSLIPDLLCPGGCSACCRVFGIPSQTRMETQRINAYLAAAGRRKKPARGTTCPYVSSRGCTAPFIRSGPSFAGCTGPLLIIPAGKGSGPCAPSMRTKRRNCGSFTGITFSNPKI